MSVTESQVTSIATSAQEAAPSENSSDLHASVVNELLDLMRRHTKQAGEGWSEATTLEDIGVDSFDLVELIFEVEDKYDIGINFNANTTTETLLTAGDIARVIETEIAKKKAAE